jgi:hypothetical protein
MADTPKTDTKPDPEIYAGGRKLTADELKKRNISTSTK